MYFTFHQCSPTLVLALFQCECACGSLLRKFNNNGKITNRPIGIYTIRKYPQIIANFTGHCFRRSSASIIVENGATSMQLQKFGRWKSATVAEGYVDQSKRQK